MPTIEPERIVSDCDQAPFPIYSPTVIVLISQFKRQMEQIQLRSSKLEVIVCSQKRASADDRARSMHPSA
jgi:hypothetical protein